MNNGERLAIENSIKKEYDYRFKKLKEDYESQIRFIRTKYLESISEFKIGDFVGNVTGIVKVEKIKRER